MNKKPTTSSIIQRLFFIGMKFRTWFILALIISIILAIVSVYRPILTQQIVDIDILKLKDNNVLMKDIYFLIGLVVAETILNFFLVFLSNYIAQNVIRDIRERLYHKLIYFKTSFFDKTAIGNLVTRAVGDVETIATVPWIINNTGAEYAKIGIGRSTGTKLISASGHIKNPGVYEIELGLSVYEFMNSDEYLGGMSSDRPLKAFVPGGSSVPVLPAHLIYKTANGEDRLMSYESLSDGGFATGSMLGSGGFIVYNDTSCIVRNTWNFSRFYHHESCGQCSPSREGTGWMEKVLNRIENGLGREEDIDLLLSIQSKIEGNTICPLGDAAAWPVAAAIRHFREEFEYHIRFPEKIKNRNHFVDEPFEKVKHLVSKVIV